jgi:hypothetical protein
MADSDLVIKINSDAYKKDAHAPVRGGGTRIVYAIPSGVGMVPLIWISHEIVTDDNGQPAHECLILISKKPLQAIPGTVPVAAIQSGNIPTTAVEW